MDWSILWREAPFMAATVYVIHRFLQYLKVRDVAHSKVLKEISSECHANQREATAAIRDNTTALSEVRIALVKINGRSRL